MQEMVKRKSFLISTLLILTLIVLGFHVPNWLKALDSDSGESKLLIIDEQNIFEGNLTLLQTMNLDYKIEIGQDTYEEMKQKIENGDIDASIVVEKQENNVKIRYIVESTSMMEGVPEEIISSMNALYTNLQIGKLGLTEQEMQSITPNFEFSLEQTEEKEASGNIFAMMLMSMVLFYAIYFCAYQVSSSITTEKTSKIMETLVTSTTPTTIVLGKTIGIGLVGLVQLMLIVGTALVSAKSCLDEEVLNNALDMSNITVYLGGITMVYFLLGYFAYALLYALTGSTVSKPEDIQSANTPVALLTVIGFYLSYFTMMNPTSNLNFLASILPISSPFCMPFRIMMGVAGTTDVLMSIAVLLVTILLIAKIAIKIYSSAILNYGTKMSLQDMVNIYKEKQN